MSDLTPDKHWWTAQELADAALPGLPRTKRRVNALAKAQGWDKNQDLFRRRPGRGGGFEYHWTLLPVRAQAALTVTAETAPKAPDAPDRDMAWAEYETRTDEQKAKAMTRLAVLRDVEALENGKLGRREAVHQISALQGVPERTIWSWFKLVSGVEPSDRLAYLVPKHGRAAKVRAEIDPEFMALVKSDWLRPSGPALAACYRRATRIAEKEGLPIAPLHQVRRDMARSVTKATAVLARKGADALKRMYPAQVRDKTAMHALEAVNGDFHRFDVFVRWPGETVPIRPQMVAFQDIYSGRILSWRLDKTPNSHAVQLAAGDMVEAWGIPGHVLLDNGREFAAKSITGGVANRYRFKVREDDIPGLFTSLGCEIHWAQPYSGQSKPIERAFRDICEDVSKDPRFEGAYTGNAPDAKPENYGNRAVPLEEFLAVLAEGIELHNTRTDRRSEVAYGRSFAAVFDESYATAPIRKATAAQRRMWLMGADGVRVDSRTGAIKFMGNVYFDPVLHAHMGQKLIARFDTGNLHDGLHVYTLSDQYVGHVACQQAIGFFDVDEGRAQQRAQKAWIKAERERLKALDLQRTADLGTRLTEAAPELLDGADKPETKVVQLVTGRTSAPKQSETPPAAPSSDNIAQIEDRIAARRRQQETDEPRERFRRALELEDIQAKGGDLTKAQAKWLSSYGASAEYRTWSEAVREHGRGVLGQ